MCKECLKKVSDWDRENLSPKDMFDLFGPPTPRRLCYYHRKIHDGLIDKPETESFFDCMAIWDYRPLIYALAWKWSAQTDMNYNDLVQQGCYLLATLAYKVDWEMHPKQISKYIKRSVEGGMKSHIGRSNQVITMPHFFELGKPMIIIDSVGYDDSTRWYNEEPDPEEQCLLNNQLDLAKEVLAVVLETLNEREAYVLWNHIIAPEPQPMREIADQFHCSKDSIFRDSKRVIKLLREEGEHEMLDTNVRC